MAAGWVAYYQAKTEMIPDDHVKKNNRKKICQVVKSLKFHPFASTSSRTCA